MENNSRTYLQPSTVAQLANIELKARLIVEGFITGLHRSPYHGFSVEFAEHRQYQPGDDLRYMDWKLVGRADRYYVKQFEEETNLRAMIAVDASASMKFASAGNISKFQYASYLAAALAYLMIKQQDAVGLTLYDNEIRSYLPSRSKRSYIQEILKTLEYAVPSGKTGTAVALNLLAERISRRGLVIILSDFFDEQESIITALKHFRHKGHEVIVMQILDPRERDFDFGWDATFKDLETGEEMVTQPYQIRKSYADAMKNYCDTLKRECLQRGIEYVLLDVSQPFDTALREYLGKRTRM
ncbi:DUF58 domain-containing protein [Ignavibacteria bacterium]|nr:DUF58 domain-containing protein [Bacteroidota bacterium]MCZ2131703.1 DUF58 domain-containing protein [Bacteroidota bacterium]